MTPQQLSLFDFDSEDRGEEKSRALLDRLLADSKVYKTSESYKQLLEFVVRLRNFAPFNAMLLQIQKPGLMYAASAYDWETRFGRKVKEDARPLLILWPFGPVALVYDSIDTEGNPLPEDVSMFQSQGAIRVSDIARFRELVERKNISWRYVDAGDANAGAIRVLNAGDGKQVPRTYLIKINQNHDASTQFCTLAHELAHLMLGHIGPDSKLNIPQRRTLDYTMRELEAESVAYLVCARNGVQAKSQTYLADFVRPTTNFQDLDLYQIMRAAGHVESLLNLTAHTKFLEIQE